MTSQKHVLVVEDDEGVLQVLSEMLEEHGYRVSGANDGKSMHRRLESADPIDAVVLDATMPGEGSDLLALQLKQLRLPMVMVSGSTAMQEFADANGLLLLQKPFNSAELVASVAKAIANAVSGRQEA
jgi:two-component system, OmpR family, response regulator